MSTYTPESLRELADKVVLEFAGGNVFRGHIVAALRSYADVIERARVTDEMVEELTTAYQRWAKANRMPGTLVYFNGAKAALTAALAKVLGEG